MQGSKVVHMAPPANRVPQLMDELFVFLKETKNIHIFIKSCVFHYEAEFIHPFSDGNGRMGRLWQSVILAQAHPIFECVPVESLVRQRQKEYYRVLQLCDNKGDSTLFVEFMLGAIKDAVEEFVGELKSITDTPVSRLEAVKQYFGSKDFCRNDYMRFHKTVSSATASRDLALGVSEKILRRMGNKALAKYVFN
jgi:Fic family protein